MVSLIAEHNIAYFPVPKAATTSVKHALYQLVHGKPFDGEPMQIHPLFGMPPPTEQEFEEYRSAWRFAIVRDPVERFLSAYQNRIFDYHEVAEKLRSKPVKKRLSLRARGIVGYPSVDRFARRYEKYCAFSGPMKFHTMSFVRFLGADLSYFDAIYTTHDLPRLQADLARRTGITLDFPRENASSRAPKFKDLSKRTQERLLQITAPDYRLLADYFTPPAIT